MKDIAYSQVAVWPQKNNGSFFESLVLFVQVFCLRPHSVSAKYQAVNFAEYSVLAESRLLISTTHSASAKSKISTFGRPLRGSVGIMWLTRNTVFTVETAVC